jgi:hypothetical protein
MRKYFSIICMMVLVKIIIHGIGNQNYGFHRDELLHLSVSQHLSWGYFEFPPMIAFIGKISILIFDYNLIGIRFWSSLAGILILILTCLMAIEMKGKKYSVLLAGISVLAFLPFYRSHMLFQPVAFDQLFWTLGFFYVLKYLYSNKPKYLVFVGIVLGLGLMNKYTMAVWALGMIVAFSIDTKMSIYKIKWFYLAGAVTLILILPNIIWQWQHDFPFFEHLIALRESQLDEISRWDFVLAQLEYMLTLLVSMVGLGFLLFHPSMRKSRLIGIASVVVFLLFWFQNAKAYYLFAAYPVLFAAGSVAIESLLEKKRAVFKYLVPAIIVIPMVFYIPYAIPVLPINDFIEYADLKKDNDGRYPLTGDYADMFGWEEQVQLVDSVYHSLTPEEKGSCVLWAENYGEAGALQVLGKKYKLPDPICRHGNFWLWGYGDSQAKVWISLGNEQESVDYVFKDVRLVKIIRHPLAIDEENGIPLYICRNPKIDIAESWLSYRSRVFD